MGDNAFKIKIKYLTAELLVKGMLSGSRTDQQLDELVNRINLVARGKMVVSHIFVQQASKSKGSLQNFVSISVSTIRFQIPRS